jgi:hypothetical protein
VEEPAFLIAVDGVVGCVEIENNARRGRVGLEKDADEQPFMAPSSTLSLR